MRLGSGDALGPAVTPRYFAWQAWQLATSAVVSRGRRGTGRHPPSFCVAAVLLMGLVGSGDALNPAVTPCYFAWQTWHLATSAIVSRGRRGTWRHPPSFCVASVAHMLTKSKSYVL